CGQHRRPYGARRRAGAQTGTRRESPRRERRERRKEVMAKKREKSISRRDFVKTGAAAGVGAAVLTTSGTALAQVSPVTAIRWNYEADVVIIGAGCMGLPAAIRARDLGASVIVIDQNFDPGGKMLHSGGQISPCGGDPLQLRDISGEGDKEGLVTAPRQQPVSELTEDTDFLF